MDIFRKLSVVVFFSLASSSSEIANAAVFERVVGNGDLIDGVGIVDVSQPELNQSGELLFLVRESGESIYMLLDREVARRGDLFGEYKLTNPSGNRAFIDNSGRVAIYGEFERPGVPNSTFFSVGIVERTGLRHMIDLPSGFSSLALYPTLMNDLGDFATFFFSSTEQYYGSLDGNTIYSGFAGEGSEFNNIGERTRLFSNLVLVGDRLVAELNKPVENGLIFTGFLDVAINNQGDAVLYANFIREDGSPGSGIVFPNGEVVVAAGDIVDGVEFLDVIVGPGMDIAIDDFGCVYFLHANANAIYRACVPEVDGIILISMSCLLLGGIGLLNARVFAVVEIEKMRCGFSGKCRRYCDVPEL